MGLRTGPPEDNGSSKEAKAPEPYPPEVLAVIEQFPTFRLELGAVWRHRLGEDTSEEAMGSLVAYCGKRVGNERTAPMRSYEAAEVIFGERVGS